MKKSIQNVVRKHASKRENPLSIYLVRYQRLSRVEKKIVLDYIEKLNKDARRYDADWLRSILKDWRNFARAEKSNRPDRLDFSLVEYYEDYKARGIDFDNIVKSLEELLEFVDPSYYRQANLKEASRYLSASKDLDDLFYALQKELGDSSTGRRSGLDEEDLEIRRGGVMRFMYRSYDRNTNYKRIKDIVDFIIKRKGYQVTYLDDGWKQGMFAIQLNNKLSREAGEKYTIDEAKSRCAKIFQLLDEAKFHLYEVAETEEYFRFMEGKGTLSKKDTKDILEMAKVALDNKNLSTLGRMAKAVDAYSKK